jgi:DNA-binding CsgD family transcriptional regulator
MSNRGFAVILDLVGSTKHPGRQRAQAALTTTLHQVNMRTAAIQPLTRTIGDECQALYPSLSSALYATLLVRLWMPTPFDCRSGIGEGDYRVVGGGGPNTNGQNSWVQDGTAWWSARRAIETAEKWENGRLRSIRTWFITEADTQRSNEQVAIANAYLMTRDHLVSSMKDKDKVRLRQLMDGQQQAQIAEAEGVTESAISQALRRSGAHAVVQGARAMQDAVK